MSIETHFVRRAQRAMRKAERELQRGERATMPRHLLDKVNALQLVRIFKEPSDDTDSR